MDSRTLTISATLEYLRTGELNSVELSELCLHQIERLNPLINAFITVTRPERQGAKSNNFLAGIPLGIKDLIDVAGIKTTAGTPFFKNNIPTKDAFVIEKFKQAGATIIGKTNTHEIALGVTGINPHFGTVKNPWDTSRITGGSSSGSAAAVAAGMCMGALGTDTGGSIRIPAALCGVVGLKPTFGRVSLRGVVPLSWHLDHVGPITRSVKDAALLLQSIAGYDPADPACVDMPVDEYLRNITGGVKGWRVALAAGDYAEDIDSGVQKAMAEAVEVFESLGAEVEKVEMDWLSEAAQANGQMVVADAAAYHRERLAEHPDWFGADVRQRLETGRALSVSDYILARRSQAEIRRRFEQFFTDYDILLLPTTPITAPPIADLDSAAQARPLTSFSAPFNLAGLPALSVPCGFTDSLPVGLQIVSAHWEERKILQAGFAYEQATEWHNRTPGL
jgi:aspartyl-tRNA(Asn)/glutamyl-tRNA(Gln) amidotransferase subunit A